MQATLLTTKVLWALHAVSERATDTDLAVPIKRMHLALSGIAEYYTTTFTGHTIVNIQFMQGHVKLAHTLRSKRFKQLYKETISHKNIKIQSSSDM